MWFVVRTVCSPRICFHLATYCTALCVVSTFLLLYQSISVEKKIVIAAAELQRKLDDFPLAVEITRPSESNQRLSLKDSLQPSLRSVDVNDILWSSRLQSSLNDSLLNVSLQSSLNESHLQSRPNETRRLFEMLRKKGIVTIGGSGYDGRYKPLRNLTKSQVDSVVTAFGIPNLNPSNFKEQLLACTGLTLAKAMKPVNITNDGNVVMPKHFQKCKSMSFQKTGKTVALLSFPGSGNSWVRQLIETTTGIYTGTYKDCDDSYIFNGMIGEGVYTDNVIAVKIHFPGSNDRSWLLEHNIIYVVRNPFDAVLAEWNRQKSALKDHNTAHLSTTTVFGKYHTFSQVHYVLLFKFYGD